MSGQSQRYSDMEWENIVVDVCVQGLPEKLWEAARQWQAQFALIGNIPRDLRAHKANVAKVWDSAAGRAFQDHLEHLAKQFEDAENSLMPAVRLLNDSAEHLYTAITNMPIPNNFVDDIAEAHRGWLNTDGGKITDSKGNVRILAGKDSAGRPIQPGDFKAADQRNWLEQGWHQVPGWFHDKWEDWFGNEEKHARERMADLDNGYNNVTARTDDPRPTAPGSHSNQTPIDPKGYSPGGGAGGFGGVGSGSAPHGGFGAGGIDPGSGTGGLPGYGSGSGLSGTGLAGAGTGGLSGLGAGTGGLGGGAGSAALDAPGRLGGAGSGAGLTPLSKIGSPTGMMMPPMAPGGRGAGGRGARATGRGGAGAGMMGGGHGAGTGTDDDRSTWLTEDEDPWGGSSDGAPPVLGR
jgi:hypothetical protein